DIRRPWRGHVVSDASVEEGARARSGGPHRERPAAGRSCAPLAGWKVYPEPPPECQTTSPAQKRAGRYLSNSPKFMTSPPLRVISALSVASGTDERINRTDPSMNAALNPTGL